MVQVFKYIIDINMIWINALFTFEIPFWNEGGVRGENITIGILLCGVIVTFSNLKLLLNIIGLSKEEN